MKSIKADIDSKLLTFGKNGLLAFIMVLKFSMALNPDQDALSFYSLQPFFM